jgi:hypothetical protein
VDEAFDLFQVARAVDGAGECGGWLGVKLLERGHCLVEPAQCEVDWRRHIRRRHIRRRPVKDTLGIIVIDRIVVASRDCVAIVSLSPAGGWSARQMASARV